MGWFWQPAVIWQSTVILTASDDLTTPPIVCAINEGATPRSTIYIGEGNSARRSLRNLWAYSLSLQLSLVELFDSFLLLPSLLSDLTVGGSPSESSPVSADFFCRCLFPTIRWRGNWPQQCDLKLFSTLNRKDKWIHWYSMNRSCQFCGSCQPWSYIESQP